MDRHFHWQRYVCILSHQTFCFRFRLIVLLSFCLTVFWNDLLGDNAPFRVVDEAGKPVAQAQIELGVQVRFAMDRFEVCSITADTTGAFEIDQAPFQASEKVKSSPPGYKHYYLAVKSAGFAASFMLLGDKADAADRAIAQLDPKRIVLKRGFPLSGTVVGPDGIVPGNAQVDVWAVADASPLPEALRIFSDRIMAGADGSFSLNAPTKRVMLQVHAPPLAPDCIMHEIGSAPVKIQLSAGRTITGAAVDSQGRPIADTELLFRWGSPRTRRCRTDVEGRYTLKGVPDPLCLDARIEVLSSLYPLADVYHIPPLPFHVAFSRACNSLIRARLLDAETGDPIGKTAFRINQAGHDGLVVGRTEPNGVLLFRRPKYKYFKGYSYEVVPEGYLSLFVNDPTHSWRDIYDFGEIHFKAAPPLRIAVVDENDVPQAGVTLNFKGGSVATDEQGRAVIRHRPSLSGYLIVQRQTPVHVMRIHEKDHDVQVVLPSLTTQTFQGRVMDSGGFPVSSASLKYAHMPAMNVAPDGRFVVNVPSTDKIRARISALDYYPKTLDFPSPEAGKPAGDSIDVTLVPTPFVSGYVLTSGNRVVQDAFIQLLTGDSKPAEGIIRRKRLNGSFLLQGFEPGKRKINAIFRTLASPEVSLDLAAEGRSGVMLKLESGRWITLRVVDDAGHSCEGISANVSVSKKDKTLSDRTCGEKGLLRLLLPAAFDRVKLAVSAVGCDNGDFVFKSIDAIPGKIVLKRHATCELKGIVLDETGKGIPEGLAESCCKLAIRYEKRGTTSVVTPKFTGNGDFSYQTTAFGPAKVWVEGKHLGRTPPVSVEIKPEATVGPLTFKLSNSYSKQLSVKVVDPSGKPVHEGDVTLRVGTFEGMESPDQAGWVHFPQVPSGLGFVAASWLPLDALSQKTATSEKDAWFYAQKVVQVGKEKELVLKLHRDVLPDFSEKAEEPPANDIETPKGFGTLVLHVLHNGKPADSGDVTVYPFEDQGNIERASYSDGTLEWRLPAPCEYIADVYCEYPGRRRIKFSIEEDVTTEKTVEIVFDQADLNLNVRLPDGGVPEDYDCRLFIFDEPVGNLENNPIKGGRLSLKVPPGELSGFLKVEGYPVYRVGPVMVHEKTPCEVTIQLEAGGVLLMPALRRTCVERWMWEIGFDDPRHAVFVQPCDAGHPVQNAVMHFADMVEASFWVDHTEMRQLLEQGTGNILIWNNLPPGEYRLKTDVPGYNVFDQPFVIKEGQATVLLPSPASVLQFPDYAVLVFYFLLMLGIGIYFFKYMRNIKDYFSGGNSIPWWLSGVSFYMSSFSVTAFISYPALCYKYGFVGVTLLWVAVPATLFSIFLFAKKWRRARIDSPVEYLEGRYHPALRQIFVWQGVPVTLVDDGLKLFAIGSFISVSLGLDLVLSMWVSGGIILLYTFLGGLWAVAITDFIQFIVLTVALLIILPLSLAKAFGVTGGLAGFMENAPDGFFSLVSPEYDWFYVIPLILLYCFHWSSMNWSLIQRYYCVPNEKDAVKTGWLVVALYVVGPPLMFLPAMAAIHFLGDIAPKDVYPRLCIDLLPAGMVGLVIAAMFSATMSMLSSHYNVCAGVITKDVFQRFIRPKASQKTLVMMGRLMTLLMGLGALAVGQLMVGKTGEGLFKTMVTLFGIATAPVALPMMLGLLWRKVSAAAALTGYVAGIAAGLGLFYTLNKEVLFLGIQWKKEILIFLGSAMATLVPMLLVMLLKPMGDAEKQRVGAFFKRLNTPIGALPEDQAQPGTQGLSPFLIVGIAILLIGLIMLGILPWVEGAMSFWLGLGLGALLMLIGGVLAWLSRGAGQKNLSVKEE